MIAAAAHFLAVLATVVSSFFGANISPPTNGEVGPQPTVIEREPAPDVCFEDDPACEFDCTIHGNRECGTGRSWRVTVGEATVYYVEVTQHRENGEAFGLRAMARWIDGVDRVWVQCDTFTGANLSVDDALSALNNEVDGTCRVVEPWPHG